MRATVKSPLHHNGTAHEVGSVVELTEEQARSLAAIGVVELLPKEQANESAPSSQAETAENQAPQETPKTAQKTRKARTVKDDE